MKLYGYWRSSAAYRVRIALHLKELSYEYIPVHLVKDGGEQHATNYVDLNPTHLVPTFVDGDFVLNQSIAIIDYLDAKYPQCSLYPENIESRALVSALMLDIACEIHPVNNLRIQQYLVSELHCSEQDKLTWSHHWMHKGFSAIEEKLKATSGLYCFGDQITIADLCLIPQVYNAKRFNVDMSRYPLISKVVDNCNLLPAFISAMPENQPDAV
ncbi:maleylacetoacetate isomerase [Thalassotalea sediminis]|uniref:maleylacetoacetate isomerase n=1 Tax=Thalassotalea sediminis TaxID=1759089 RepID=UPI0025748424|nr:maleylacetoacetate isomerase [Thalassotalea sediminis]